MIRRKIQGAKSYGLSDGVRCVARFFEDSIIAIELVMTHHLRFETGVCCQRVEDNASHLVAMPMRVYPAGDVGGAGTFESV